MGIQELSKEEVEVVAGGLVSHKLHLETGTPHHLPGKSLTVGHVHSNSSSHHLEKLGLHHLESHHLEARHK